MSSNNNFTSDEIQNILYSLEYNILFELISFREDIFKNMLEFLNIFDISYLDRAISIKDMKFRFIDTIKKIKFFSVDNSHRIIVDSKFISWKRLRDIEFKTISYHFKFDCIVNKHNFLKNCKGLIEINTNLFGYIDLEIFDTEELRLITNNNPNIEEADICLEDLHNYNLGENLFDIPMNLNKFFILLKNVKTLNISSDELHNKSYNFLDNIGLFCPNVTFLSLDEVDILNDTGFINIVSKLQDLSEINIYSNDNITSTGFANGLLNCYKLKTIKIYSTNIESSALFELSNNCFIENLYAPATFYNDNLIQFCFKNTQLKELCVEHSQLDNNSFVLCYLYCNNLHYLNISHTDGNLEFLLDPRIFNTEQPHKLPKLTIVIDQSQKTEKFITILEEFSEYFRNITIGK